MEGFGGSGFSGVNAVTKKRRTVGSRRPRTDSQFTVEGRGVSPASSIPSSDDASKLSSGDNAGYDRRKEFNLNSSAPRTSSFSKSEGVVASKKIKKEDKKYGNIDELYRNGSSRSSRSGSTDHGRSGSVIQRCNEGSAAPAGRKSSSKSKDVSEIEQGLVDGSAGRSSQGNKMNQSGVPNNGSSESKLRKVKLKVGGVTRTIHAKSENDNGGSISAKPSHSSDISRPRQKLILQDNSDDDHNLTEQVNGLHGVPSKDFSAERFSYGASEVSRGKGKEERLYGEEKGEPYNSEAIRKSKRVPKRRVLHGSFDDDEEDDEVRYLEKLKISKASTVNNLDSEGVEGYVKKRKLSNVSKRKKIGYDVDKDYSSSRSAKDSKKRQRKGRESNDIDYVEEEEPGSDDGPDDKRKKQMEHVDTSTDDRMEPLTTRQRALQSGKGASTGGSLIEFPDGLPPVPPRRQKEKLSEVEQQAKKAEVALRRKLQVEKANKELEAEAIRKILGQDSSRKKKEEKARKEREERAQRKAAESLVLGSSTVRWVMGPTGTVVTFADDVGLPSIFSSKPCSYPPPREKCAGPSCTNPYKYRDAKLNLPLCSLQCYRAVQEDSRLVSTC